MEQRTKIIIVGVIILLLILAAGGITLYIGKISPKGTPQVGPGGSLSTLPVVSSSPTPGLTPEGAGSEVKTLTESGLTFNYPSSWGLLTCGNSSNFEFDPTDGVDLKNVVCDRAIKPITFVFTNYLNCKGEEVMIGSYSVTRSKIVSDGEISYGWCLLVGTHGLNITHRVSPAGARATSKEDFSSSVEQIIADIKKL